MRFTWPGPLSVSHVWWDHSPSMSIHGYSKEIEYGNAVINKHTLNCSTKNVSVRILYLHHCHHHYPCIIMNISIINHYICIVSIFLILIAVTIQTFILFISNHQILNDCAWQCVTVTSENWCWSTVSESGIGVSHIHSRNPGYNGSTRKKLRKFLSVLEWIVDALDFHGEFAIWQGQSHKAATGSMTLFQHEVIWSPSKAHTTPWRYEGVLPPQFHIARRMKTRSVH